MPDLPEILARREVTDWDNLGDAPLLASHVLHVVDGQVVAVYLIESGWKQKFERTLDALLVFVNGQLEHNLTSAILKYKGDPQAAPLRSPHQRSLHDYGFSGTSRVRPFGRTELESEIARGRPVDTNQLTDQGNQLKADHAKRVRSAYVEPVLTPPPPLPADRDARRIAKSEQYFHKLRTAAFKSTALAQVRDDIDTFDSKVDATVSALLKRLRELQSWYVHLMAAPLPAPSPGCLEEPWQMIDGSCTMMSSVPVDTGGYFPDKEVIVARICQSCHVSFWGADPDRSTSSQFYRKCPSKHGRCYTNTTYARVHLGMMKASVAQEEEEDNKRARVVEVLVVSDDEMDE